MPALTDAQKQQYALAGKILPAEDDIRSFAEAAGRADMAGMRRYLTRFGLDCINEPFGHQGLNALMHAAIAGQDDAIDFLLDWGADVDMRDKFLNRTALMLATFADHDKTVTLLLDRGADIEARAEGQLTPLLMAAMQGARACVEVLLERGADDRAVDFDGIDAIDKSLCGNHDSIAALVEAHRRQRKLDRVIEASESGLKRRVETKPLRLRRPPNGPR